ncbi:MAG: hypothetical protein R2757_22370 [Draconibacterium sp.]
MISMEFQDILEAAANFVTAFSLFFCLIGLTLTFLTYRKECKNEMLEREYGTYCELDDKYLELIY